MAKPNGSLKKIQTPDNVVHEIIPDKLGKGSYVAELPNLSQDETIALAKDVPSIPQTSIANQVLKSTSTAGTVEWGDASGGTATDVQINGSSITSSNVANIITNSAYNSSSNKIATMNDIPSTYVSSVNGDSGAITDIAKTDLSNVTYPTITANATTTGAGDRVIEQYMSSNSRVWYRKWASGWKECGVFDGSNSTSITLPLTFSNTNYIAIACMSSTGTYNASWSGSESWFFNFSISSKTASSLVVKGVVKDVADGQPPFCLYCCGY